MRGAFGWLFLLVLLLAALLFARDHVRRYPQDVPWTRLDLADPIGAFTSRKLVALAETPDQCRTLLQMAGAMDQPVPPLAAGPDCGFSDGMLIAQGGRDMRYLPRQPVTSCPVAAALILLERQVIDPGARRHLGSEVAAVEHAGSYNCRRINGRSEGRFSEHATANALDITAFRLSDGRRISVRDDWQGSGPEARFLAEVRDGACMLFATTLSPDYNQAHSDHLHLDQARRGRWGGSLCS